ncbi:MAG: class I SAM-dependent methyltransferase [Azonexus sp.]
MSWSEGYMADTEYTSHYFAELAPPLLDLAALTAGVMPPERENGRFRYCELGCGNGMTTNILAACYPNAEFVGIDFMPVHIANSRRAAKRGGLKNARFLELSFADAAKEDLGQFDYIVAHGVYSWVSPQNRQEMVEFYRRFLAPGGLIYLSYNTNPGWLGISPVQKVVSEYARTLRGPSPARTQAGFEFSAKLLNLGAAAFKLYPGASQQIEKAPTQPANYLSQEYLNEAWYPLYVTDVFRELAPAKLEYVASATLAENDFRFLMTDELAAVVREQPTEELRQLVKDITINARFRRDIYSKGGRRLSGLDQRQMLKERSFALIKNAEEVNFNITYLTRQLSVDTPSARAIVAALAGGTKTLGELMIQATGAQDSLRVTLEVLLALCIGGWVQPVDRKQSIGSEMNRSLTAAALEDTACNTVATTLGGGLLVNPYELALLSSPSSLESVDTGLEYLKSLAERKGRNFITKNRLTGEAEDVDAYLREQVVNILKRVEVFQTFGLLPAHFKTKG